MMSIRLRLTLLYSLILAMTLIVFGAALYTIQSRGMMDSLREDLFMTSEPLKRSIEWSFNNPDVPAPRPDPPPPAIIDRFSQDAAFRKLREREIVRILNAKGVMIASPLGEDESALPLSEEGFAALRNQQDWWEIAETNGERLLILNRPVSVEGNLQAIIQVGRSLAEHDRSLAALSRTLLIAGSMVILAAFGIGWGLAGISLRPIHRITQTARSIGEESDFGRRVNYRGPNDEIGQLATTFNVMLSRLEKAYQQVSQALTLQREFVADVSHELRTPLTTIRGNLGLLLRQPPLPDEVKVDILTDIEEESDRLIRLVNDLLLLARADARQNLRREPVAVRPVIEETCRQARLLDPRRELIEINDEAFILADRDALKQVVLILLDNAMKHSTGRIEVRVESSEEQVMIDIQDGGPGIPPETLPHLFDRFYRGEEASTVPGVGLGLPIAKSLVEGMGGTITIQSEVNIGSVVRVSLPRHCPTADPS